LAVHKRIVDDGRKEIDGLDDGQILGQLIDAGIIVRAGADQEIRIIAWGKVAQNLRDALRGQLPCSAGARSVIDQTLFSTKKQHAAFSLWPGCAKPQAACIAPCLTFSFSFGRRLCRSPIVHRGTASFSAWNKAIPH
jgi:hypothetical protein